MADPKVVAISQPRYLPVLSFLQRILLSDVFVMLDTVQHQRREYEHRTRVRDAAEPRWLSLPIDRSKTSRPDIQDMTLSDTDWVEDHKGRITNYYRNADHFDASAIDYLYADLQEIVSFCELTQIQLERTLDILDLDPSCEFIWASSLETSEAGSALMAEITRAVGGTTYLSGPMGIEYLDVADFDGLGLSVHDYHHPTYPQQGDEFEPWLSWIDGFLSVGRDATVELIRGHGEVRTVADSNP